MLLHSELFLFNRFHSVEASMAENKKKKKMGLKRETTWLLKHHQRVIRGRAMTSLCEL